jgi:hypothetical protein
VSCKFVICQTLTGISRSNHFCKSSLAVSCYEKAHPHPAATSYLNDEQRCSTFAPEPCLLQRFCTAPLILPHGQFPSSGGAKGVALWERSVLYNAWSDLLCLCKAQFFCLREVQVQPRMRRCKTGRLFMLLLYARDAQWLLQMQRQFVPVGF